MSSGLPYMPTITRRAIGITDQQAELGFRTGPPRPPAKKPNSYVPVKVTTSSAGEQVMIGRAGTHLEAARMRLAWYREHRPGSKTASSAARRVQRLGVKS